MLNSVRNPSIQHSFEFMYFIPVLGLNYLALRCSQRQFLLHHPSFLIFLKLLSKVMLSETLGIAVVMVLSMDLELLLRKHTFWSSVFSRWTVASP